MQLFRAVVVVLIVSPGCRLPVSTTNDTSESTTNGAADSGARPAAKRRAIVISVDALSAIALDQLLDRSTPDELPAFRKLQRAWTHDARSDPDYTDTLPNHASMLTGLPSAQHGWTINSWDGDATIDKPSVFDILKAHDERSCLFASKTKFGLFVASFGHAIDFSLLNSATPPLIDELERQMRSPSPCDFVFLHIAEPDNEGHTSSWGSDAWNALLRDTVDGWLQRILDLVTQRPFEGKTWILLTADHGGEIGGYSHSDASNPHNRTIPFYVWGPDIPSGKLELLLDDPSDRKIHNGHVANLALGLLGFEQITDSTLRDLTFKR